MANPKSLRSLLKAVALLAAIFLLMLGFRLTQYDYHKPATTG
jgi:hypothetical protein